MDIHCHVLPNVDDGAQSMETALQMVEEAYREGIRCMVATPHYYPGHRNRETQVIFETFQALKQEAEKRLSGFELLLGNEIYYKEEAVELLRSGEIFRLNESRYILIEFHVATDYKTIYHAIKKVVMQGYYPVIAHIERYACLYRQEKLIKELVEAGAYMQVNTQTFLTGPFDGYKKYCLRLMEQGVIHFLGSDCHNMTSRKPIMQQTVACLERKISPDILESILIENPERFLKNDYI